MKVIIKELSQSNKNEIVINVSEDDTTYDAKKEIEKLSNIRGEDYFLDFKIWFYVIIFFSSNSHEGVQNWKTL